MEMTAEEFDQSITLHPTLLEPLLKGKTAQEIEEIKNFRLAIGFVNGVDFPGGSIKGKFFPYSVGPNGEKAVADRFAIFYKNGVDHMAFVFCWLWKNQTKHLALHQAANQTLVKSGWANVLFQ